MKVFGRSNEYCIIFQTFSDFMKETNHPRSLNGSVQLPGLKILKPSVHFADNIG